MFILKKVTQFQKVYNHFYESLYKYIRNTMEKKHIISVLHVILHDFIVVIETFFYIDIIIKKKLHCIIYIVMYFLNLEHKYIYYFMFQISYVTLSVLVF